MKWAVDPVADVITTAGDLIYGTAADTVARLGIGTAGQVLTVNSGATAPQWASPAGATFVGVQVYNTTAQSVASETDFYPTFNTESWDTDSFHSTTTNTGRLTVPSGQAGKYLVYATCGFAANGTGWRRFGFAKNRTTEQPIFFFPGMASQAVSYPIVAVLDLAVADYVEILVQQNSGGSLNYTGALAYSAFGMYKIG